MEVNRVAFLSAALLCFATTLTAQGANTIFFGGEILTIAGQEPEYVEAVAVSDGKIIGTGTEVAMRDLAGRNAFVTDLEGRFMMPGFIDAHSHFVLTAVKLSTVNLDPPPVGDIESIADIQAKLTTAMKENPPAEGEFLWGWGYDNGFLQEQRHPTRHDLDQVSTEIPIGLYHFSAHVMVANTKALELLGYDENTEDPIGGVIRRDPGTNQPNGVLEETSIFPLLEKLLATAEGDNLVGLLDNAQEEYLRNGYTTITEMAGDPAKIEALRQYANDGKLKTDLMVGALIVASNPNTIFRQYSPEYRNGFRIGGGKVNLDGGTPGRTAFLREPYYTQEDGVDADYRGYSSFINQETLNNLVVPFYEAQVPIFIHALGDAAIDQAIAAVQKGMEEHPYEDPRTQLIHLQVFDPDQMDTLQDLGVATTFQITHNFYFADFHNEVTLGPDRTRKLNPMQSAIDAGFSVSSHHDSPVHRVNQLDLIWIATNRSSRSGTVYGPEERISVYSALRAATAEAAYQFREDDIKGTIEVGKLADFVVLDRNPLNIDKAELNQLKVKMTIKEGSFIFDSR